MHTDGRIWRAGSTAQLPLLLPSLLIQLTLLNCLQRLFNQYSATCLQPTQWRKRSNHHKTGPTVYLAFRWQSHAQRTILHPQTMHWHCYNISCCWSSRLVNAIPWQVENEVHLHPSQWPPWYIQPEQLLCGPHNPLLPPFIKYYYL